MTSETEYKEIYARRLAAIEKDSAYTILSSMNQPMADDATKQPNISSTRILSSINNNRKPIRFCLHAIR